MLYNLIYIFVFTEICIWKVVNTYKYVVNCNLTVSILIISLCNPKSAFGIYKKRIKYQNFHPKYVKISHRPILVKARRRIRHSSIRIARYLSIVRYHRDALHRRCCNNSCECSNLSSRLLRD